MRVIPVWLIVVWSVFFITPVFAFDTSRIEDPEVRERANKALPSKTAYQIQRVEFTGSKGHVRESLRKLYWRRSSDNDSRVLVRVLEPVDDKGVAVLINDDADRNVVNYMTYSPKLRRVRRVTGESFFGSILSITISSFLLYFAFCCLNLYANMLVRLLMHHQHPQLLAVPICFHKFFFQVFCH